MNSSILEQRNRFALIGVLMTIVSLMFLFYMGSSLGSSTKKYLVWTNKRESCKAGYPEEIITFAGRKQETLWKRKTKHGKR